MVPDLEIETLKGSIFSKNSSVLTSSRLFGTNGSENLTNIIIKFVPFRIWAAFPHKMWSLLGFCFLGGCNIPEEDDDFDFGSGAGFYVNATQDPWCKNYRMYDYVTVEVSFDVLSSDSSLENSRIIRFVWNRD